LSNYYTKLTKDRKLEIWYVDTDNVDFEGSFSELVDKRVEMFSGDATHYLGDTEYLEDVWMTIGINKSNKAKFGKNNKKRG